MPEVLDREVVRLGGKVLLPAARLEHDDVETAAVELTSERDARRAAADHAHVGVHDAAVEMVAEAERCSWR